MMHLMAQAFYAAVPVNLVDSSTATALGGYAGSAITKVLPYAGGLLAAVIGWRYVRKFVR